MYTLFLQWFPEYLNTFPAEFREFIHKEYTPVRKRNNTRAHVSASACKCLHGSCMMRTSEGTHGNNGLLLTEQTGDTIYRRNLEALIGGKWRHDIGYALCNHGFTGSGWSYYQ